MSLNQGTDVRFESSIVRPQQSMAKPHALSPYVSSIIQARTKIKHVTTMKNNDPSLNTMARSPWTRGFTFIQTK